jgi:ribonuclease Z
MMPVQGTGGFLLFVAGKDAVLVDCGGSPGQRLMLAGTDPLALTRVVITHIHPDHVYGLPSLFQTLVLLRRTAPLRLACREEHEAPLRGLLGLFGLLERPGLFPVVWEPVPPREGFAIGPPGDLSITASPNAHGAMPNMALRFEVPGRPTVVYSSDTEPSAAVEAPRTGPTPDSISTFSERRPAAPARTHGRSSGECAARAGVTRLILAHIDAGLHGELDALREEACARFSGRVEIARELVPYPL